jgi:hypothetical protein
MFADTITLALTGVGNKTVIRINQDQYASEYLLREATESTRLRIRHSKVLDKDTGQTYDRHNVEIVRTIFATSTVAQYQQKCYVVWETLPSDGAQAVAGGLAAWMQSTTPKANLAGLVAWES